MSGTLGILGIIAVIFVLMILVAPTLYRGDSKLHGLYKPPEVGEVEPELDLVWDGSASWRDPWPAWHEWVDDVELTEDDIPTEEFLSYGANPPAEIVIGMTPEKLAEFNRSRTE
jgi:hypothetical protein